VSGVGAAIHLEDDGHRILGSGALLQLIDQFINESTFSFITHADAGVGDDFANKCGSSHI